MFLLQEKSSKPYFAHPRGQVGTRIRTRCAPTRTTWQFSGRNKVTSMQSHTVRFDSCNRLLGHSLQSTRVPGTCTGHRVPGIVRRYPILSSTRTCMGCPGTGSGWPSIMLCTGSKLPVYVNSLPSTRYPVPYHHSRTRVLAPQYPVPGTCSVTVWRIL